MSSLSTTSFLRIPNIIGLLFLIHRTVYAVAPPPFVPFYFTAEPQSQLVAIGQALMLPCSATYNGQPQSVYVWERNKEVESMWSTDRRYTALNGSLVFTSITTTGASPDIGNYRCVADFKLEHENMVYRIATPSVTVSLATMMDFTVEPSMLMLHPGETAMFRCNIVSNPQPVYEWLRDGVTITTSSRLLIHGSGQVLEIRQVSGTDAGSYQCKAQGIAGERVTSSAQLSILNTESQRGSDPDFITRPWDTRVVNGSDATLYCAVNGTDAGGNLPTVRWLYEGQTIDTSNSDRYEIVGSGSLRIINATKDIEGEYICRGENLEDVKDSEAVLTVEVPPYFVTRPSNSYGRKNEDIILECDIQGFPQPQISWYMNSELIEHSEYYMLIQGSSLKIVALMSSDAGYFQCIGRNSLGTVHATAQLIVLEHNALEGFAVDSFNSPTDLVVKLPPSPTNLRAEFVSQNFITLKWDFEPTSGVAFTVSTQHINNERVRAINTTSTDYTVRELMPSTLYNFTVQAYSRAGRSTDISTLIVETTAEVKVPSAVIDMKAWPLSQNRIRVAWEEPTITRGAITKYRVFHYTTAQSSENYTDVLTFSTELNMLTPYTSYYIRVVAFNANGHGPPTDEAVVTTYSDKPSAAPSAVAVEQTDDTTLKVTWQPPPIEGQNGRIISYKIKWRLLNRNTESSAKALWETVDADRRLYNVRGLDQGASYQVKVAAVTVNGTGIFSPWRESASSTVHGDESRPPGKPRYLQTKAFPTEMIVSWAPALDDDVVVRGYRLSYGTTTPDEEYIDLDSSTQIYTITGLEPQTIYVLKIVASNNAGESQPTRQQGQTTELLQFLPPESELRAPTEVLVDTLSSTSVLVRWYDNTLGNDQHVMDNRVYTVKYNTVSGSTQRRTQFVNSTQPYAQIDGLRPYTRYEFSVMISKDSRTSFYSFTVRNITNEAPPTTAPEDLTISQIENKPRHLLISWQPPSRPNGRIIRYTILSSTNNQLPLSNWVPDNVGGDTLNYEFTSATSATVYFFRIVARNSQGSSPPSPQQVFQTSEDGASIRYAEPNANGDPNDRVNSLSPQTMWIIIACVSAVTAIAIAALVAVLCRKRILRGHRQPNLKSSNQAPRGLKNSKQPDLWLDHNHLEMKALNGRLNSHHPEVDERSSMLQSHSQFDVTSASMAGEVFEEAPRYSTLGRQRPNAGLTTHATPHVHRDAMPHAAVQPMNIGSDVNRPLYPRTQFTSSGYGSTPRVHVGDTSHPASEGYSQQRAMMSPDEVPPPRPPPMEGRVHPLRSFSIPAPPAANIPKHIVKPQPVVVKPPSLSQYSDEGSTHSNSLKRPARPPYINRPREPEPTDSKLSMRNGSAEQLSSDLANLDNIMQDLHAIKQDFQYA